MSLPFYYRKSPIWIQNVIMYLKGLQIKKQRFNKYFHKELNTLLEHDPKKVRTDKLKHFMAFANDHSEFWRKRFEEYKVDLSSTDLENEIKKLPILTKKEVKENVESISIKHPSIKTSTIRTSGTTGSGLIFPQTIEMENSQWAVWWRYRIKLGLSLDMNMGWFSGRSIIPISQKKPPFWRYNSPNKQVMFSAHHLSIDTVEYYYHKVKKLELKWLHGYPSQLSLLGSLILEKGLKPLKVDFVTLGGENLLLNQEQIIQKAFGVKPYQHYGLAEGVVNISQDEEYNFYFDNDFALTELIETEISNKTFKLVGTNYLNLAFPLIRYDTNDIMTYDPVTNIIESINGRNEDYVTLPNGVKLGRLDHLFKDAYYIAEAQIYQKDLENIRLNIKKNNHFNDKKHSKEILNEARERFGEHVNVTLNFVDAIEKSKAGKFKFVISDIK